MTTRSTLEEDQLLYCIVVSTGCKNLSFFSSELAVEWFHVVSADVCLYMYKPEYACDGRETDARCQFNVGLIDFTPIAREKSLLDTI